MSGFFVSDGCSEEINMSSRNCYRYMAWIAPNNPYAFPPSMVVSVVY